MLIRYAIACAVPLWFFILLGIYVSILYDEDNAPTLENAPGSNTPEYDNDSLLYNYESYADAKTIFQELQANQFPLEFGTYDEFSYIEYELQEIMEECPTGMCRSKCIEYRFCQACGICNIVRLVRSLLHQISLLTPEHLQSPVGDLSNTDAWYVHEPYTAEIRRAIVACPNICPPELIHAEKFNPRLRAFNFSAKNFLIHFPRAYLCPRHQNIDVICVNALFWLKKIDHIDFGDGISPISAPDTTICIHETDDILSAPLDPDYATAFVYNEFY